MKTLHDVGLPTFEPEPPMWLVVTLSSMAPACVIGLLFILGIMFNIVALSDVMTYVDLG